MWIDFNFKFYEENEIKYEAWWRRESNLLYMNAHGLVFILCDGPYNKATTVAWEIDEIEIMKRRNYYDSRKRKMDLHVKTKE